jgi:hypothetical protein
MGFPLHSVSRIKFFKLFPMVWDPRWPIGPLDRGSLQLGLDCLHRKHLDSLRMSRYLSDEFPSAGSLVQEFFDCRL